MHGDRRRGSLDGAVWLWLATEASHDDRLPARLAALGRVVDECAHDAAPGGAAGVVAAGRRLRAVLDAVDAGELARAQAAVAALTADWRRLAALLERVAALKRSLAPE